MTAQLYPLKPGEARETRLSVARAAELSAKKLPD